MQLKCITNFYGDELLGKLTFEQVIRAALDLNPSEMASMRNSLQVGGNLVVPASHEEEIVQAVACLMFIPPISEQIGSRLFHLTHLLGWSDEETSDLLLELTEHEDEALKGLNSDILSIAKGDSSLSKKQKAHLISMAARMDIRQEGMFAIAISSSGTVVRLLTGWSEEKLESIMKDGMCFNEEGHRTNCPA